MRVGIAMARCPAPPWGGGQGAGSGVRWRLSRAASRAELRRGLGECGGRGWGVAGRRGGAGAGQGGEDGLHGARDLDGGENAQPAATARAGEDIEIEPAGHQGGPGPCALGAGGAGAGLALGRREVRGRAAVADDVRARGRMRGEHAVIHDELDRGAAFDPIKTLEGFDFSEC